MDQNYHYNLGVLFSEVAKKNANSLALKYPDGRKMTYGELDVLSNKIAWFLVENNLKKGDLIAIFNNKSPIAFATMLGCLKIGVIYTNLDISSPLSRLHKILAQSQPLQLINDFTDLPVVQELSQQLNIPVISLGAKTTRVIETYPADRLPNTRWTTGNTPAYLMFTSGSTGFPKGAVISHQNLLNFIRWGQAEFQVQSSDIFTNVNPIYFDNSVFDFYTAVFSGASLVPFSVELTKKPMELIAAVEKMACNSWFSVPSLLVYLLTTKAISQGRLPTMRRFIFGGEGFPKPKLKKLYEFFRDSATLYNVYGPTECTCICSSYVIGDKDFEDLQNLAPLGYLSPNFDYELLPESSTTESRRGELALKGPNIGLGYYNDPVRTAKVFIQNPNNPHYPEIIYKTGDLVEVDEQGHLHFRGRADFQIKHMGYRIELEEIEAALNTLEYVDESAVIYKSIGSGIGFILAFISVSELIEQAFIQTDIRRLLPDYMLPKKIKILDQLPKNKNGKIDRAALKNENYKTT